MNQHNLSDQDIYNIIMITEKISKSKRFTKKGSWEFNLVKYLGGWQFNWYSKEVGSLMWRSVDWSSDLIELYTGNNVTELLEIGEL